MQLMKIFMRQFQNSLCTNFYVVMNFELIYIDCRSSVLLCNLWVTGFILHATFWFQYSYISRSFGRVTFQ